MAAFLLLLPGFAAAQNPRPSSPLSDWYEGLRVPGTAGSCCGVADCHATVARTRGDHYEVMIDGHWIWVPDHAILRRSNPTGEPIICYSSVRIYCFVPGPGT